MQALRIESKDPIHLIGLHARFIMGTAPDSDAGDVIGPLWAQLLPRLEEVQRADDSVCYGYSYWGDPEKATRPDEIEYVAGTPAAADAPVPEGMLAVETAGGLYAIFEHHGPIWTFHETLMGIYREWLPNSEYEGSGLGDVEQYDQRWSADGEDSVFEYWCGIKPRA